MPMFLGGCVSTRLRCLRACPSEQSALRHASERTARRNVAVASKAKARTTPFQKQLARLQSLEEDDKDFLLDLYKQEKQINGQDKELDIKRKELIISRLQRENYVLLVDLLASNTQLAQERGLLNYCGMIQLVEWEMKEHLTAQRKKCPSTRRELWITCLGMEKFNSLLEGLVDAGGYKCLKSGSATVISDSMASFYEELSPKAYAHGTLAHVLEINYFWLSKPRARMMTWLGKYLKINYTVYPDGADADAE